MAQTQKFLQYDVLERLGEGARSVIYAVVDPMSRKTFALKHVLRLDPKDIRFVEQMQNEFDISKNFNHPNLRKSYDLKIIKTLLVKTHEAFLIMELFEGKTLDQRLPTDVLELCDTFIQAAEGLKAMHEMGYVHCDIKPNNILRSDAGMVKVIDFGQSCKIGMVKERIQGTPDYIAPEQVSRRPVTQQTDVFNLGATMYWAFTGGKHVPTLYNVNKQGENSFLLDTRIETPIALNPALPQNLSNLIMESVSTQPKKRPGDMKDVITRVELAKHILLKNRAADKEASSQ